jgi:hypothetical protein
VFLQRQQQQLIAIRCIYTPPESLRNPPAPLLLHQMHKCIMVVPMCVCKLLRYGSSTSTSTLRACSYPNHGLLCSCTLRSHTESEASCSAFRSGKFKTHTISEHSLRTWSLLLLILVVLLIPLSTHRFDFRLLLLCAVVSVHVICCYL